MLRKIEMKIDGEEYRGLMLRDSGLNDEEARPLLLEERIEECERAIRGLRENIRELLLERAKTNAGTVLTMGIMYPPIAPPEDGADAPKPPKPATEPKERRGGHSKNQRGNLDRMLSGKKFGKTVEKKKKEKVELDPLVEMVCVLCRDGGDGQCEGCIVNKALKIAERQETPGKITLNARAAVCAGCLNRKRIGGCATCRLGIFWKAKDAVDGGESIEDAAMTAEAEYQAMMAERG